MSLSRSLTTLYMRYKMSRYRISLLSKACVIWVFVQGESEKHIKGLALAVWRVGKSGVECGDVSKESLEEDKDFQVDFGMTSYDTNTGVDKGWEEVGEEEGFSQWAYSLWTLPSSGD